MTPRDVLRELLEVFFLPAIMARGALNQLGYLFVTAEHPETEPVRELTPSLPLELEQIQPCAVKWVHLFSTIGAVMFVVYFLTVTADALVADCTGVFAKKCAHYTTPQSLLGWVSLVYILAQWLFVALWDPLVLLTVGEDEVVDGGERA
ncbi:hypothetical protein [Haloarchaeobius sp. DFWS5]|uniref:hypothetical protein n=1 Tax=Haloarchaeobius sp. DFWS5 TaxID=3446114 RepID=UPI003EB9E916